MCTAGISGLKPERSNISQRELSALFPRWIWRCKCGCGLLAGPSEYCVRRRQTPKPRHFAAVRLPTLKRTAETALITNSGPLRGLDGLDTRDCAVFSRR
jgi:hypothetical protein